MKNRSLRAAASLLGVTLMGAACSSAGNGGPLASTDQSGDAVTRSDMSIGRLRAEYRVNPLGIDVAQPRLDWLLGSSTRGRKQSAYRILVASSPDLLAGGRGDLWDTGKVVSDQTAQIPYAGAPLADRQRAWWKVQAWDENGQATAWSAPAWWERGLTAGDWQAKWIASPVPRASVADAQWIWFPEGDPLASAPAGERYFRRTFTLPAGASVADATCTLVVDDEFELFVNGKSLGYEKHWQDIKRFRIGEFLNPGAPNVIAVRAVNTSQSPAGFIGDFDVSPSTGAPLHFTTDAGWKSSSSAATGWQNPGFDDGGWPAARALTAFGGGPWGTVPRAGSPAAYLRTHFSGGKIKRARIYATALGLYQLWLNGRRVGADELTPGFTDYRKRVQVQTYDVTALLNDGDNAVGAVVADGWFNGKVGFLDRGDFFGTGPNRLLFQLELEQEDGTRSIIGSDTNWKYHEGPIFEADLLDGETYDARRELTGWSAPGYDDGAWSPVQVVSDGSGRQLVSDVTAGVQPVQELSPVSVKEISPGIFIYDLGQNMVGRARLRVTGAAGSRLRLRFGEVLNPDGTLYTDNLRGAKATDSYILRGGAAEVFEPSFTTHGFRYVELSGDTSGLSQKPNIGTVTGVVLQSFMPPTGSFSSSSDMVNRLQSNILWGQRGNFVSIPTDCPQRDERLGWMGDAQVFARTATFNMDVASFYTKWLRDVDDGQAPNGAFPEVAPRPNANVGTPAWGDAGVIVPWTVYLAYGDTRILSEHYPAMSAWVDYIGSSNPNFLWQNNRSSDYGDWLSVGADSDKEVIATAFYAHSADLVARTAHILGKDVDAQKYDALFASIKNAFQNAYVAADGTIRSNTQALYALALRFDLLPEGLRAAAGEHLADDVAARGHLSTGFVGVSHLLPALTMSGRTDLAYQLLDTDTFPSWFYEIKQGATTIWERWDGIEPNGQFEDPGMNSFNHYSFGSVGEWMYATIAGIQLDEARPGYRHFFVRPQPGGGLTSARGALDTIRGTIVSDWKLSGGVFTLDLTVPVNTTASVSLPYHTDVRESGAPISPGADGGYAVSSGHFVFTAAAP